MPKISIITTTYKHEFFIEDTIKSILSQNFSDWELLIGDDSPDNNTWEIIKKYINKYPEKIKAWHHNPNKGIVDNMNFLISKCSKESLYITFLEGDDMFTEKNLITKIKTFEENPEIALIYNELSFIDNEGNIFNKNFLKSRNGIFYKGKKIPLNKIIKDKIYHSYSSLTVKKNILLKEKIINPTDNKIYSVSDWDFFLRISTNYNVFGIETPLTLYRKHDNNFTKLNIHSDNPILTDLYLLKDFYKKENILDKKGIKLFKGKLFYSKSCFMLEKGEKNKVIKNLWKYIIQYPTSFYPQKIKLFIRLLIPYKLQLYLLNKLYYKGK